MATTKKDASLINQFAQNLMTIPDDILTGALNAMEDEDGKLIIQAYSKAFKNQFQSLGRLLLDQEKKISKEILRGAEEMLSVTAGVELSNEIKPLTKNLSSNIAKIGLVGIIQMIKKIIKWLIKFIFKRLPAWINDLIDLIDEILNEFFGIGSPKLANVLSLKEQNYLSELTKLAILNREERYLFDSAEDDEF